MESSDEDTFIFDHMSDQSSILLESEEITMGMFDQLSVTEPYKFEPMSTKKPRVSSDNKDVSFLSSEPLAIEHLLFLSLEMKLWVQPQVSSTEI